MLPFGERCACCDDRTNTGGCARCQSSRTYCGCGALLVCGCGKTVDNHACPRIIPMTMNFEINVF